MTIHALPAIPGVASLDWKLDRNVAELQSPFGRTLRRVIRAGDCWKASFRFPLYNDDDAGVLTAWLAQISAGDAHWWATPPQNAVRGNWSPADLASNGTFLSGATTGWSATSSTLSVNARRLKVKNTGAAAGRAAQNITMEVGKPHVVILDGYRGIATSAQVTVNRQSDGVAEANSGVVTVPGRIVLLATPTVAPMNLRLLVGTANSGDDVLFGGVSVTRCLQIAGAGQTGSRINVDGGPASVNGALKAGEFVCFLGGTLYQLVRLVEDFDTDSSGAGTLVVEPGIRTSPADNAPVIVRYPFVRFLVDEHMAAESVNAPNLRALAIDGVEDVTP